MILTMLTFVIYDTGMVARDKMKVQAAADAAAISQASVKARSMNMLAYSNVAKRSIFAINSTYISSLVAYAEWTTFMTGFANAIRPISKTAADDMGGMAQGSAVVWRNEIIEDFDMYSNRGFEFADALRGKGSVVNSGDKKGQCKNAEDKCLWGLQPPRVKFMDKLWGGLIEAFKSFIFDGASLQDAIQNYIEQLIGPVQNKWSINLKDLAGQNSPFGGLTFDNWGGLSKERFGRDLRALDNYQRYMSAITPWWGWTEQIVKGIRNGATTSGSAPQPAVVGLPSTSELGRAISGSVGNIRIRLDNTRLRDELPVRPGIGPLSRGNPDMPHLDRGHEDHKERNYMYRKLESDLPDSDLGISTLTDLINNVTGSGSGMNTVSGSDIVKFDGSGGQPSDIWDEVFGTNVDKWVLAENFINSIIGMFPEDWSGRTSYGTAGNFWYEAAMTIFTTFRTFNLLKPTDDDKLGALEFAQRMFTEEVGPYAPNPWTVQHYRYEADWLANSSNIILTYKRDDTGRFGEQREKYGIVKGEEKFGGSQVGWLGGQVGNSIYRASGYWGMARSEIVYQKQQTPTLWEPAWSAKIRPVTYPNEFREGEYRMSSIYHDVLPSMAITSALGIGSIKDMGRTTVDLFQMERNARAMGWSTMNGVPK